MDWSQGSKSVSLNFQIYSNTSAALFDTSRISMYFSYLKADLVLGLLGVALGGVCRCHCRGVDVAVIRHNQPVAPVVHLQKCGSWKVREATSSQERTIYIPLYGAIWLGNQLPQARRGRARRWREAPPGWRTARGTRRGTVALTPAKIKSI